MNSKNNLYLYFLAVFLIIVSSLCAEKNSEKLSFDFGITRIKKINLWPIVSYYESSDTTEVKVDLAFSLFRYNLDRKINRQYSHLIPIYWDNDAIEKRDFRLLSLYYPSFFRYIQDRENETTSWRFGEIAPQISLIKYTKSKDGSYLENNLFFLLWIFRNPDFSTTTLLPLFSKGTYHYNLKSYEIISPLYWHFKSDDYDNKILFPLMWKLKNQDYSLLTIPPLYWKIKKHNSQMNILLPFWYLYSDTTPGAEYSSNTIFPIYWHRKNTQYQSLTISPIFSHGFSPDKKREHLMITPLYWKIKKHNSQMNILLPFWYLYSDTTPGAEYSSNTIFPIYWHRKNTQYQSLTISPIFSYGFSPDKKREHLMITPLYWKMKKHNSQMNILLPFWYLYSDTTPGAKYSSNTIFPIY
ncbi:MAG: hypothetical protein KAS49_08675, partial [Candidatus Cloacimonetes bacterium]|nr:hypothetical protein [Candidatus Cloacimonadota bacterium]